MHVVNHPSRYTLERLATCDLPADEAAATQAHVESCTECRTTHETLLADDAQFKTELPYAAFRIEHERRKVAQKPAPLRWRWLVPAFSGVAALALVVMLVPRGGDSVPQTRTKGAPEHLRMSVLEHGQVRPGSAGETLDIGSVVQLGYDAGASTHMALFSIDSTGTVQLLFPEDQATLAPLPAGPQGTLPFSLTLDAAPEERFVAFFAAAPLPLEGLRQSLAQAGVQGPLHLPNDVRDASLTIYKRTQEQR